MEEIKVLKHGHVKHIGHYGDDRMIVRVARTSTGGQNKSEEEDKKLLAYLYKNRHTSPFEQVGMHFDIKMPIFVMRQFVRHRTFHLNEFSARYMELPDEFEVPEHWRAQAKTNRQSSDPDVFTDEQNASLERIVTNQCESAYEIYEHLIKVGVAKEMARFVLPVNIYTQITVFCDLHNLIHFLKLRLHPHAQYEVRVFAQAMKDLTQMYFPWSIELMDRFKIEVIESHPLQEDKQQ